MKIYILEVHVVTDIISLIPDHVKLVTPSLFSKRSTLSSRIDLSLLILDNYSCTWSVLW